MRTGLSAVLISIVMLGGCSESKEARKTQTIAEKPAYYKVDPAVAGTLSGKIVFAGKKLPGKRVDLNEDPECAKLHKGPVVEERVAVNRNGTLANVFVYVKRGLEGKQFEPPTSPATIDQKGCWFHPRVIGIQTGQTLNVTNSDPVTHNIHPLAQVNREWNQSQSPGAEPLARRFVRPEAMIRVKCNIHPWMRSWIGVTGNPYFAVTGSEGTFEMRNLPPGKYVVEAWQEELGSQEQEITVTASGKTEIAFTFSGAKN